MVRLELSPSFVRTHEKRLKKVLLEHAFLWALFYRLAIDSVAGIQGPNRYRVRVIIDRRKTVNVIDRP